MNGFTQNVVSRSTMRCTRFFVENRDNTNLVRSATLTVYSDNTSMVMLFLTNGNDISFHIRNPWRLVNC